MYCPQCGTESSAELHYCRSCGANLKVIGKAVSLSEAIARSDSVPSKLKEMVKNFKVEKVTDEVSRAMERMNKEIVRSANDPKPRKPWWLEGKKKTAEERFLQSYPFARVLQSRPDSYEAHYFLANALVLKLPPDVIARIPFEIDPVVHVLWVLGLIPMLSGLGHIIAGFSIRPEPVKQIETADQAPLRIDPPEAASPYASEITVATPREAPASVTDRTTNILDRDPAQQTTEGI